MSVPDAARAALQQESYDGVRDFLERHSGLPGPRSNLELLAVAGEGLPAAHAERLRHEASEYLRCCGVLRLALDVFNPPPEPSEPDAAAQLTHFAADASWRVREAVAMAGQRVGDDDPAELRRLVTAWVDHPDPLVKRAGVAAICEPRLLRDPAMAAFAVESCKKATAGLLALDPAQRKLPASRTLRQALGYCWSVAIAADPTNLPEFLALGGDPDADWIVRENRGKARLKKLLAP